ncbi:MAG: hypothetical protein AAGA08_09175 [Pseudomonadota bacterium]
MDRTLHIFAVNTQMQGRHTFLSRSKGKAMALPHLAGWLGLRQGGLNTDKIELFPVSDLAGMALSDYVTNAFDLRDPPSGQNLQRLNALDGHVVLIPDEAIAGKIETTAELTCVASLPMARADHSAAALEPVEAPTQSAEVETGTWYQKEDRRMNKFIYIVMSFVILVALMLILSSA